MAWQSSKYRVQKKTSSYRRPAGAKMVKRGPKGKFSKTTRMVPKFINPFKADSEKVQLTYRQTITLDPNANTIDGANSWVFRANSLFDPDKTGLGNQPTYFDNYASLFGRYRVSFAKIKATVISHSVNTAVWNGTAVAAQPNYAYKLGIIRDSNDLDFSPNVDALLMQSADNVKWRYVSPQLNGRLPQLSMKCAPHKTRGVDYRDDTLTAATNSNPSGEVNFRLFVSSADAASDPPTVKVDVELTFWVEFYDRATNQAIN